jgi:hypothetical protein
MKYLAYALIAAGTVGVYARYNVASANAPGTTGNVSSLSNYDPALLLGIAPSGNFPDAGAFVDGALVVAGIWLLYR